jgi:hypothetical protein
VTSHGGRQRSLKSWRHNKVSPAARCDDLASLLFVLCDEGSKWLRVNPLGQRQYPMRVLSAADSQIRPRMGVRCEDAVGAIQPTDTGSLGGERPFFQRRWAAALPLSTTNRLCVETKALGSHRSEMTCSRVSIPRARGCCGLVHAPDYGSSREFSVRGSFTTNVGVNEQ